MMKGEGAQSCRAELHRIGAMGMQNRWAIKASLA